MRLQSVLQALKPGLYFQRFASRAISADPANVDAVHTDKKNPVTGVVYTIAPSEINYASKRTFLPV